MKVLHVIPAVAMQYGGPSRAVFDICEGLGRQGVETLVATTDADGDGRLDVDLGRPISFNGSQVIFFRREWSERFKYSRQLSQWIKGNVHAFDLVHIDAIFSHSSIAAARFCRLQNVPYVVRPIGSLSHWSMKRKHYQKKFLWQFGVKQMLEGAAAVHYTSTEEKRQAEGALGLDRGVVIPPGIATKERADTRTCAEFRAAYRGLGRRPYVLLMSRLHPVKGLELLFEVFLDLAEHPEFNQWRLLVAGDGDPRYVSQLKHMANDHRSGHRVIFAGWLDGEKKTAALQEASILALPSHHENFGFAAVEALSMSVPVFISTHVHLAETVRKAGAGWIISRNRTDMKRGLAEALTDQTERSTRGAAGLELVESTFTPNAAARGFADLYRLIVRQHLGGMN